MLMLLLVSEYVMPMVRSFFSLVLGQLLGLYKMRLSTSLYALQVKQKPCQIKNCETSWWAACSYAFSQIRNSSCRVFRRHCSHCYGVAMMTIGGLWRTMTMGTGERAIWLRYCLNFQWEKKIIDLRGRPSKQFPSFWVRENVEIARSYQPCLSHLMPPQH